VILIKEGVQKNPNMLRATCAFKSSFSNGDWELFAETVGIPSRAASCGVEESCKLYVDFLNFVEGAQGCNFTVLVDSCIVQADKLQNL
jgi:hypothetical protein